MISGKNCCCLAALLVVTACSGDDSTSVAGQAGAGASAGAAGISGSAGAAGSVAAGGQAGAGGAAGDAGQGGAGGVQTSGGPFRHGVNYGYIPGLSDSHMATLARRAGANSARLSLPERHLDTWGYGVETGDMASYEAAGIRNNVVFLSGPSAAHSSAPAGTPDWQRDHYIPANLHEPLFLSDATVNPDNYWAAYVEKTVQTYKPWIKVWSVWNEPDWVADWQVTKTWDTTAPTAAQLPRFNGSIYDYVRMLRITHAVAKKVDPDARIAVGGLGYPGFLSAVLRYTDNPVDGTADAEHPLTGAAYFDIVDMHYYPIFSPGNSDTGVDGLLSHRDAFQKVLDDHGAGTRPFLVTESGAPHLQLSSPGGPAYAASYLLKAMTLAQATGMRGLDWFAMSDAQSPGADPFDAMGLYESLHGLTELDSAKLSESGVAYATLGKLLDEARYDAESTAALGLSGAQRGAAFRVSSQPGAPRAWVLWARASGTGETASGSIKLPSSQPVDQYEWNWSQDPAATQKLPSTAGSVSAELLGTPRIFVEN